MSFINIYAANLRHLCTERGFIYLDETEQLRTQKISDRTTRAIFIKSRSFLRHILAQHLQCKKKEVPISYNQFGKPEFIPSNGFYFNISHSKNLCLVAISSSEIGVDIEFIDQKFDYETVADLMFSDKEKYFLQQDNNEAQRDMFYKIWTKKEAYLKATGKGFSIEHTMFTAQSHSEPTKIEEDNKAWYISNLSQSNNYQSALATPLENTKYCYFDYTTMKHSEIFINQQAA